MTREEVITEFCILSHKVCEEVFNYTIPADCICSHEYRPELAAHYQFDPQILEFIKNAVTQAILEAKS